MKRIIFFLLILLLLPFGMSRGEGDEGLGDDFGLKRVKTLNDSIWVYAVKETGKKLHYDTVNVYRQQEDMYVSPAGFVHWRWIDSKPIKMLDSLSKIGDSINIKKIDTSILIPFTVLEKDTSILIPITVLENRIAGIEDNIKILSFCGIVFFLGVAFSLWLIDTKDKT